MALLFREQNVLQMGMRFKQYRVFLVLDSSGSMEGKPWSTVVAGVAKILDHLDEDDKISASTFSDTVQQLMSFEPVTKTNAMQLIQKLANTKCNGRTALYDALAAAIKSTLASTLLVKMLTGDKEKYVLLVLTDGENNSGSITFAEAKKLMANVGEKGDLISTVFVGVNLNDRARSSLKALADAGGDQTDFYDINDMQIEEIFDRIAVTIQAAKRVTVAGVVGLDRDSIALRSDPTTMERRCGRYCGICIKESEATCWALLICPSQEILVVTTTACWNMRSHCAVKLTPWSG